MKLRIAFTWLMIQSVHVPGAAGAAGRVRRGATRPRRRPQGLGFRCAGCQLGRSRQGARGSAHGAAGLDAEPGGSRCCAVRSASGALLRRHRVHLRQPVVRRKSAALYATVLDAMVVEQANADTASSTKPRVCFLLVHCNHKVCFFLVHCNHKGCSSAHGPGCTSKRWLQIESFVRLFALLAYGHSSATLSFLALCQQSTACCQFCSTYRPALAMLGG